MAYDLAATVPLRVDVRDTDGNLTNATDVDLVITLPDGTLVTPAPVITNPPAQIGKYAYDYLSAAPGRHMVRWTSTGPATAYTDVFYVRSGTPLELVSLADIKKHLGIDAAVTDHDDELRDANACAGDVVEFYTGTMARRTVTEKHSSNGGPAIVLRQRAMAITSVTENGIVVDPAGYSLSDAGVLYRVSGYVDACWPRGRNNIEVTYEAGASGQIIPASVIDANKELVRINFRPQLGGAYSPFDQGNSDDYGTPTGGQMRFGFFVPNIVIQRLQAHAEGPTIG